MQTPCLRCFIQIKLPCAAHCKRTYCRSPQTRTCCSMLQKYTNCSILWSHKFCRKLWKHSCFSTLQTHTFCSTQWTDILHHTRREQEDYFPIRDGNGKFILFLIGTGWDGTGNSIVNLRLILKKHFGEKHFHCDQCKN